MKQHINIKDGNIIAKNEQLSIKHDYKEENGIF